jgi:hypothetical protein
MKRLPSIFARRELARRRREREPAASALPQPHLLRWEVVVNASLAAMQLVALVFLYFAFQAQERALFAQDKSLNAQQNALTDQVFARLDDRDAEIVKMFFEHPHLRAYFHEGVPVPSGVGKADLKIRQQVVALADLHLMFIEMFDSDYIRGLPDMAYGSRYDLLWKAYFLELFKQSPALCERYLEVQDQYSPSMCERYARFTCKCKRLAVN